ncbi:MAG: hypothetical protein KA444_00885, partial [Bacteroidia bacterium]|nr:hypothetical protein [Bacteroidia bacterium]
SHATPTGSTESTIHFSINIRPLQGRCNQRFIFYMNKTYKVEGNQLFNFWTQIISAEIKYGRTLDPIGVTYL